QLERCTVDDGKELSPLLLSSDAVRRPAHADRLLIGEGGNESRVIGVGEQQDIARAVRPVFGVRAEKIIVEVAFRELKAGSDRAEVAALVVFVLHHVVRIAIAVADLSRNSRIKTVRDRKVEGAEELSPAKITQRQLAVPFEMIGRQSRFEEDSAARGIAAEQRPLRSLQDLDGRKVVIEARPGNVDGDFREIADDCWAAAHAAASLETGLSLTTQAEPLLVCAVVAGHRRGRHELLEISERFDSIPFERFLTEGCDRDRDTLLPLFRAAGGYDDVAERGLIGRQWPLGVLR